MHPLPDELAAFSAGRLAPARSLEIDAHLDECAACRAALPSREPPALPDLPLPPGYDLIEEVGRGGMGVVYRARRRDDGHEVAIKTLLPDYRRDAAVAGYLEHEAAMTARLRHLRVLNGARLRRYSDDDPTPFIEFPWVPGTTLGKMVGTPLAREYPLRLVQWVIQCAKAVEAAHRHDPPIVHFDLKPENLLVYDRDGEAVLIDFGLASEWPPPPGESRTGLGTPAYMAPEVANGWGPLIGPRTDVFALGGMLCAVLTGQPPYDRQDFGDTDGVKQAARDVNLDPALRRLDAVREHPELVAFAKRCLSPEPALRPADAGEVWRELERLTGRQAWRFPRVGPRIWVAVAGVLAACLLLVVLLRDRPPTPDELLTAGPWARYVKNRTWTDEQRARIQAAHEKNLDPKKPPNPFLDEHGNVIMPADVGAYPLVKFHRPEWVEAITLSHEAKLRRPYPPHDSDFTPFLPPLSGARVTIPIPDAPGWATAVNGDRLCKKPLTVAVAYSNGQYVDPLAAAGGGLAVTSEPKRYGFGTELTSEQILSGLDKDARGGGNRSFATVEKLRLQWEQAKGVKLQVKVRGVKDVYEYDLHPRKLGWEKHIRDSEAD